MEESVAVQSEISMSVVTEQWRAVQPRHPRTSMFRWPSWLRRRSSASPPPYHLLERRPVEKPSFLRKHVNSEPVIFLSCTAFGILGTVYPLFLFWARCIEMYDSFDRPENDNSTKNATDFCMHISNMKDRRALDMVEADVAQKTIYLQLCSTLTSLVTAPIFGAWSDYHGRRRPFIVCQFGSLLYGLLICAGSFLFVGRNVYAFLAPAELCFGLFSGIMVFTLASTIVIDECRQQLAESRSGGIPTRIMVACAVQFLGFFTGNLLTSLLLSHQTSPAEHGQLYALALLLTTTFFALGLVYTQFWVRETHFPGQDGGTGIDGQQPMEPFSTHLRHYTIDAFGVLVKKRDGWVRLCLMLTVCFMFVEFMSIDSSLMFLVLKQFNWSDEQFSNLCLFRVLLNAIGIVLMPQLLRLLPCAGGESIFVMAAIVAAGLGAALFAFAHTVQEVYALSLLCLLSAGTSPGFRTILSRFVPKAETGRLFALVAMVFIFCPLVSKAIFNNFYWATMRQWPGMVFLLMGAVHVVVLIGQILVHCLMLPMWNAAAADSDSSEGSGTFSSNSSTGLSGESDRSVVGSTTGEEEE